MILDTNALSAFADGDGSLGQLIMDTPHAAIPVIVVGEFRFGIAQSRRRSLYEAWLDKHLFFWRILEVTRETTTFYAEIRLELKRAGNTIPSNDLWIAALARQHSLPVLSRDRHFDAVSGLRRLGW